MTEQPDKDPLFRSVQQHAARERRARKQGPPGVGAYLAQIGTLGWMIVTPGLLAMFLGRWIDRSFGTGIFWTAPLMMFGIGLGCWSGWKWMHRQ
ncbi:ATP synthase protein I [Humitalea rosea]|uniref:ATP synthase protein I n=1 Tax=Humitalea rosea TaxID=990373 RepID=A0A2W7I254_9PROT|nr:AtpZ/AtpI family protein [Humitalea rosea]PZW39335.1 ATP synthase protein I [Humitalea rosea]